MGISVGTVEACTMADIDRAVVNKAIARGAYQFAPFVVKGAERTWHEWDVLQLYIYARLLDCQLSPTAAGTLSSIFRQEAEQAFTAGCEYDLRKTIGNFLYNRLNKSAQLPPEVTRLFGRLNAIDTMESSDGQ
jgi:hypothetical protein